MGCLGRRYSNSYLEDVTFDVFDLAAGRQKKTRCFSCKDSVDDYKCAYENKIMTCGANQVICQELKGGGMALLKTMARL